MSFTVQSGPVRYRVDTMAELELLFPDPEERRRVLHDIINSRSDLNSRFALGAAVAKALVERKDVRHE